MPKASRNRRSRGRSASFLVRGQQELIQITSGTPSGTFVGGQIPLIPTFEPTSRLGVIANLYSQYSIESSRVQFVPQSSTNTSGRLCLAWTFDALDADPVNCHQILQIVRSVMTAQYRGKSTSMPLGSPEKRRFAVIDGPTFLSLTSQDKQIYLPATLIYGSDGSAQSGLLVGSLIWHYRIRFFNANVPTGVPTGGNLLTLRENNAPHFFVPYMFAVDGPSRPAPHGDDESSVEDDDTSPLFTGPTSG
jgi:hypothetical protein